MKEKFKHLSYISVLLVSSYVPTERRKHIQKSSGAKRRLSTKRERWFRLALMHSVTSALPSDTKWQIFENKLNHWTVLKFEWLWGGSRKYFAPLKFPCFLASISETRSPHCSIDVDQGLLIRLRKNLNHTPSTDMQVFISKQEVSMFVQNTFFMWGKLKGNQTLQFWNTQDIHRKNRNDHIALPGTSFMYHQLGFPIKGCNSESA